MAASTTVALSGLHDRTPQCSRVLGGHYPRSAGLATFLSQGIGRDLHLYPRVCRCTQTWQTIDIHDNQTLEGWSKPDFQGGKLRAKEYFDSVHIRRQNQHLHLSCGLYICQLKDTLRIDIVRTFQTFTRV